MAPELYLVIGFTDIVEVICGNYGVKETMKRKRISDVGKCV